MRKSASGEVLRIAGRDVRGQEGQRNQGAGETLHGFNIASGTERVIPQMSLADISQMGNESGHPSEHLAMLPERATFEGGGSGLEAGVLQITPVMRL